MCISSIGVIFVLSRQGSEIARVPVDTCDKATVVSLPDLPNFSCGIYTEIIPGEAGSAEEWQEIQVARVNGKSVSINKDTYVFDEPQLEEINADDSQDVKRSKFSRNRAMKAQAVVCRVIILHPALERRTHPEGKTCGGCQMWSHTRGVEELNNITHMYSNGTFAMTKEIINTVCDTQKAPSLTVAEVGYCSVNQELCADTSPACAQFTETPAAPVTGKATVIGRSDS